MNVLEIMRLQGGSAGISDSFRWPESEMFPEQLSLDLCVHR